MASQMDLRGRTVPQGRIASIETPTQATLVPSLGLWLLGAAIVFVAVWIVGLVLASGGPSLTASAATIAHYYATHRSTALLQTYLIDGIAGAALLVFAATLRSYLTSFEDARGALASLVLAGGVAAGSISLVQAGIGTALANHVATTGNLVVTQGLFDLLNAADTFKMIALTVMVGASAIFALRSVALPAWLGWVGIALGIGLVVGGLAFVTNSTGLYSVLVVALPLLLVWVLAVGIVAYMRKGQRVITAHEEVPSRRAA